MEEKGVASTQPPRLAAWLLQHFGSSPNNESVIGDLNERYRQSRSRFWYWRQVTIAIVESAFTEICSHRFLSIRAVLVGLIVLQVFAYMMFNVFGRLIAASLHARMISGALMYEGRMPVWVYVLFAAVVCIVGMASGWIVGRIHRRRHPAMLLLYAASMLLYLFTFAMVDGLERNPLSADGSLAFYFINCTILFVGILIGGGVFGSRRGSDGSERTSAAVR